MRLNRAVHRLAQPARLPPQKTCGFMYHKRLMMDRYVNETAPAQAFAADTAATTTAPRKVRIVSRLR